MKTCCGTTFDLRSMANHLVTVHGFKSCCGRDLDPLEYAYHREAYHNDLEPLRAYQCKRDNRCTKQDGRHDECEIPCPNPSCDLLDGHEEPCPYKCGQDEMDRSDGMDQVTELAERLFNAYNEQGPNPWQTFDGRPVPKWPELSEQVQAKWKAAAREAQLRVELLYSTNA